MRRWLVFAAAPIAVGLSLFHLYTAYFGVLVALLQRSIHLMVVMFLVYLLYPLSERHKDHPLIIAADLLCAAASVVCIGYITFNYEYVINREGLASPVSPVEYWLGLLTFFFLLDAVRRAAGWPLATVTLTSILYAMAGSYMPGMLAHRGWSMSHLIAYLYFDQEGIFGIPLGISATYAALYILFGAFLNITGAGQFFIDLACSLAGKSHGGPAKIAVLSSAFFGSVSGTPVANVYGTGSFTIPMMIRLGYQRHFAGAVEAAASTGGALMPPVMGAAVFLMADITGIPYVNIAFAAIIPAVLYFLSVGLMVHFEAVRLGLTGLPDEEVPPLRQSLRNIHLIIPLVGLVYILVAGFTAFRAAFIAILLCIGVSFVRKETRLTPSGAWEALRKGGEDVILIATATASAGIIIGVVALTGFALRFTSLVLSLSEVTLIFPLVLTMAACLILGVGMPSAASYIIVAALAVPALIDLGVPTLAAHLFAYYFAVLANVTPPVCMAAYAAASVAGAPMLRTGVTASKLALTGFLVPYMFVYGPALLLKGGITEIIWSTLTALVGIFSLSASLEGWWLHRANMAERALLMGAAFSLIKPGLWTDGLGFTMFAIVLAWQLITRQKTHRAPVHT